MNSDGLIVARFTSVADIVTVTTLLRQNVLPARSMPPTVPRSAPRRRSNPQPVHLLAARAGAVRVARLRHEVVERLLAVACTRLATRSMTSNSPIFFSFSRPTTRPGRTLVSNHTRQRERLERVRVERIVAGIPTAVRVQRCLELLHDCAATGGGFDLALPRSRSSKTVVLVALSASFRCDFATLL